ncbi:hypothetical protein CI15_33505 [Paraburkholderia monticola]|uniref:Glycosyltransferase RgtA/B/C/D-like domain-containing protein n=1 Tax=Paraburkholderia monticola TaxID=1399968 RepID=A0A149PBQ4_9BURK|nr:hypothetical protein [Paraburkholderia monticola]KXU82450.1 hypothetical protein CI15_33505 [Paraburkholderia monticola]
MSANLSEAAGRANSKIDEDVAAWIGVAIISLFVHIYLSLAFTGENLHVWGDEIIYSMEARSRDFHGAVYQNYLYLALFSIIRFAHQGFLELARSINALLVAVSVPFVYATAKIYLAKRWSLLIALITGIAPITTYAAYFMPDAMYYSAFCVFAWFCLACAGLSPVIYGLSLGLLAAVLAMIKPHGVFILIGFVASQVMLCAAVRSREKALAVVKVILACIASFVLVRFSVGYLFAGKSGLSLFGQYSRFGQVGWTAAQYLSAWKLLILLTKGHVISLVLLTGPAILALFMPHTGDSSEREKSLRLRTLALSVLALMFFVTLAFSVRNAEGEISSDALRLHMRYYNFIFPLLYIVVATSIGQITRVPKILLLLSLAMVLLAASAVGGSLHGFFPFEVDSPELRGVTARTWTLVLSALLSALSIILFAWRPSRGARFFLVCALPVMAVIGTCFINLDLRARMVDMPGDVAGKMVREYLGADATHIGFFGDVTQTNQAMFYIGDADSFMYGLDEGEAVPSTLIAGARVDGKLMPPWATLPASTKWAVVFGVRPVPATYRAVLTGPDWTLYRIN